jgi:hypothetical protein
LQALAEEAARVAQLRDELLAQKRSTSAANALSKEGAARAAELASREAALDAARQELQQRERQLGQVCRPGPAGCDTVDCGNETKEGALFGNASCRARRAC